MATINGIQKRNNSSTAKAPSPLSLAINSAAVKERFEKMLGENAGSYLSSVLTVSYCACSSSYGSKPQTSNRANSRRSIYCCLCRYSSISNWIQRFNSARYAQWVYEKNYHGASL